MRYRVNLAFFMMACVVVLAGAAQAQPLTGNYTIAQTGPANFTSIGAAFDALELSGVSGPVTLTIADSATYQSNPSYSLGVNNAAIPVVTPVVGVSTTNRITLRAGPGQTPKIQGNATGAVLAGQSTTVGLTGRGCLVINHSFVTVEGLEVFGGPNFGIMAQGNGASITPTLLTTDITIRRCIARDIPDGPGIAFMGQNSGYSTNMVIEHNFVWNCFTASGNPTASAVLLANTGGAITVRNVAQVGTVIRHNTVLHTSTFNTTGAIYLNASSTQFALTDLSSNIIVCTNTTVPAINMASATFAPTTANFNVYSASTHCNVAGFTPFATWQTTGRDAAGTSANPLLASTSAPFDLHLTAASPAINRATGSTATIDIDGDSRPNGAACDSGADEFGPRIIMSVTSLNLGTAQSGAPSLPAQYNLSGAVLVGPTTITAPAGVEVSFAQAAGYSSMLTVSQFPGFGPLPIYVRIAASAPFGAIAGNISHDSAGLGTRTLPVTGTVLSLTSTVPTLNLGFTSAGVPGAAKSYTLSGNGLSVATAVTAPVGVEVATSAGGPYAASLNIPTVPSFSQAIFVRLTGVVIGNVVGNVANASGQATLNVAVSGDVFPPDNMHIQRMGPGATAMVDNNAQGPGGNGLLLLDFTLNTINSAWTVTDITFSASGTADEQAGLSFLGLYEDNQAGGTGGVFDGPFIGTLAATSVGVNFSGPNGNYQAVLVNGNMPASTSRRFFLVGKLAGQAVAGETIKVELTAMTAVTGGPGAVTGVPTGHPADAYTINGARMTTQISGPVVFQTVNNNAQGLNSEGLVVCDFRIVPRNSTWTVNSITFDESGSMDAQTDVNFVGLYVDDGDGQWEGSTSDVLATASSGVSFTGPNGGYTAGLTAAAGTFAVNQTKRFFLVVKLAGSASTGETLQVTISSMVENAPTAGSVTGVPSGATSALMIDLPTLTVNAGPGNPTIVTREKSAAGFVEMIGQVRLSASNSNFTIAGITLHTGGNGDWLNHLDPATGVQVFRDTGNGSFDGTDIQIFQGPGATPVVTCNFTANQNINMSTDLDLWVVLNLLSSAGGSPYETFKAALETSADVTSLTAGGTVKIGTLAPVTGELRVVDFRVDDFTPTVDLFAGGGSVKIEGSGFALPVTVTIGGVACTGAATVDAAGTLISGLSVPSGTGSNLSIVLTTNNLGPKTLTQTFRYSAVLPTASGSGTSGDTGGSCAAQVVATPAMLILPALAMLALRRRRK